MLLTSLWSYAPKSQSTTRCSRAPRHELTALRCDARCPDTGMLEGQAGGQHLLRHSLWNKQDPAAVHWTQSSLPSISRRLRVQQALLPHVALRSLERGCVWHPGLGCLPTRCTDAWDCHFEAIKAPPALSGATGLSHRAEPGGRCLLCHLCCVWPRSYASGQRK